MPRVLQACWGPLRAASMASARPCRRCGAVPALALTAVGAIRMGARRAAWSSRSRIRSSPVSGTDASMVAGWSASDDRVCRGGCGPADQLPGRPEAAQRLRVGRLLEPRQDDVLLVANVLVEQADHPREELGPSGVGMPRGFQSTDQLADLLVLRLHTPNQLVAVRQQGADGRPEHGLLGERVAEHELAHVVEDLVLLLPGAGRQPPEQRVQLHVVATWTRQDTACATQLGERLLGQISALTAPRLVDGYLAGSGMTRHPPGPSISARLRRPGGARRRPRERPPRRRP